MSTVSLIFTNYNYAHFLPEALDSALDQDVEDLEVVVVENGSSDDSLQVLERYRQEPRLRVVALQQNRGVAGGWNEGFRHAKGEFVAFLSSDDRWPANFVGTAVDFLRKNDRAAISYGPVDLFGTDDDRAVKSMLDTFHFGALDRDAFFRKLLEHNFVPQASCMYRRACLPEGEVFDTGVGITVDYGLLLDLSLDHEILFCPEQRADYRWHGSNTAYANQENYRRSMEDKLHILDALMRRRRDRLEELGYSDEVLDARAKTVAELRTGLNLERELAAARKKIATLSREIERLEAGRWVRFSGDLRGSGQRIRRELGRIRRRIARNWRRTSD